MFAGRKSAFLQNQTSLVAYILTLLVFSPSLFGRFVNKRGNKVSSHFG
jgi:hypothetical protein